MSDETCVFVDLAATARPSAVVGSGPAASAASGLFVVYVLTHVDALVRAIPDQPRWLDRLAGALVRVVVDLGYLAWSLVVALGA